VDASKRPTADQLLQDPFILKSQGKKIMAAVVASAMEKIEEYREERARALKECQDPSGMPFRRKKVGLQADNEEGGNSEEDNLVIHRIDSPSKSDSDQAANTGSIVITKDTEDSESSSEFEQYMKMLKEFNQKYDSGDRQEMETELNEICRNLPYSHRSTGMDLYMKKREALKNEMEVELAKLRQRYLDKISELNKIIENKQQLDLLRVKFKNLGVNIEEFDCMKDIGDSGRMFKKEVTSAFEPKDGSNGPAKAGVKRVYKIGEKAAELAGKLSKPVLSSRAGQGVTSGSPPLPGPKGVTTAALGLDKKNPLSAKNLLPKKPLVSIIADKHLPHDSSADKVPNKIKK
jgi:hypothetical protein